MYGIETVFQGQICSSVLSAQIDAIRETIRVGETWRNENKTKENPG